MTRGTVYYSYYHIFPGDMADTAVLYRVMNVDMHMPLLPEFMVRKALASHYRDDMAMIESTLAAWDSSPLQERFESKTFYRTLEQAVAAAALVRPTGQLQEDEEGSGDGDDVL
ncbi:hypothetical protein Vretimale_4258 [Volvox reticuliferus]|nr:hypothetical protein Vretimale_4258 [Volvox reticuliferus]